MTTLYFEAKPKPEDELRQAGFSKGGKTAESQIVLGLLVSEDGYPLSYSIFNGSQYEGCTMIPVIDDFVQRFSLTDFVVVVDSGLMSAKNIALLETAGYKYIIGARIRSESPSIKDITVSTNEEKIQEDMLWDGLKGYLTNTDLPMEEVISQYTDYGSLNAHSVSARGHWR